MRRPPPLPLRTVASALALALALACGSGAARDERPNVVVFLIDTLRADWLGSYGRDEPTSPAMDALAERGVLFEQASAPAPWTLPSVASMFTSRFAVEHRVTFDGRKLPESFETLAERLRGAGYATASYITNPFAGPMAGLDRGFERFVGQEKNVHGGHVRPWLEEVETPFFLYVHNMEPHDPEFTAPALRRRFGGVPEPIRRQLIASTARYRRLTRVDFKAGRPLGTTDNTGAQREVLARLDRLRPYYATLYSAAVRAADARVGSVVRALRETGHWEETLFVLVSDHGEEMGEHGGWQHDQSVYEELIRVPLVIRRPGDLGAGRRVERPVSLVDLMPTLLEAAGVPEPARGARGRSLLPLLGEAAPSETAEPEARVTAVRLNRKKYFRPWARERGDLNVALREGRWKGVWNAEPGTFELYDLEADPGEQRDRSAEHPERAARLRALARRRLAELKRSAAEPRGEGPAGIDAETRSRLRALGYVD